MYELLMKTNAFRVSGGNDPFWYTSGKIGPFYINTHYLYGSQESAENLLEEIDKLKDNREALLKMLEERVEHQYENNAIYRETIDSLVKMIRKNVDLNEIHYVSGGERRDWFFSIMCAKLLDKEHIYLFKDNSYYPAVSSGNCLHIADLITEGSSYERSWIPILDFMGIKMTHTAVCVDRKQGGHNLLKELHVELLALVSVDKSMFDVLLEKGLIDKMQYDLLADYMVDPDEAMKKFIKDNPDFIERALNSDEKTRKRAQLCIEKGFYK